MPVVARIADHYDARSSFPARPSKNIFSRKHAGIGKAVPLIRQAQPNRPRPLQGDLEAKVCAVNGNRRGMTMHDQRNLTKDAVLRAPIAMANRLIAEQSATIASAHSAIERAMETLRELDSEGPSVC